MYIFGAGELFATPLFDANGNTIATPTPVRIGTMQEMSLDFSADNKEMYGQNQFAVEIRRGKTKIDGKVKGSVINGASLNALYFGQTMTSGTQEDAYADTTGVAVPSGAPYTVTPLAPNSGTIVEDLGVTNASKTPLTCVASNPTAGQYSFSGGVYTFAAADAGQVVFTCYRYTFAAAAAKSIALANIAMGSTPSFRVTMRTFDAGKRALVVLNKVIASKLQFLATKLDDFNVPEFDFMAQEYNGAIGRIVLSE